MSSLEPRTTSSGMIASIESVGGMHGPAGSVRPIYSRGSPGISPFVRAPAELRYPPPRRRGPRGCRSAVVVDRADEVAPRRGWAPRERGSRGPRAEVTLCPRTSTPRALPASTEAASAISGGADSLNRITYAAPSPATGCAGAPPPRRPPRRRRNRRRGGCDAAAVPPAGRGAGCPRASTRTPRSCRALQFRRACRRRARCADRLPPRGAACSTRMGDLPGMNHVVSRFGHQALGRSPEAAHTSTRARPMGGRADTSRSQAALGVERVGDLEEQRRGGTHADEGRDCPRRRNCRSTPPARRGRRRPPTRRRETPTTCRSSTRPAPQARRVRGGRIGPRVVRAACRASRTRLLRESSRVPSAFGSSSR